MGMPLVVCYQTFDDFVVAYCSDLGAGEMFVATESPNALGDVISITLQLPDAVAYIPLRGRVVELTGPRDGRPRGMRVEFLNFDDRVRSQLEAIIAEHMEHEESEPAASGRRLDVLVVDDDPNWRAQIAAALRPRGDHIRFAADGFEALAACIRQPPDVVVSDVNMPKMNGWQFLRLVRARPELSKTPILFMSTLAGDRDRLRGYQLGVDDYLAKPFKSPELRARIDRLAARKSERPSTKRSYDASGPSSMPPSSGPASLRPRPGAFATPALAGDLAYMSLASVLGLIEMEQRSGEIVLGGSVSGRLLISRGKPIAVEVDGAPSEPALERAFRLLDASVGHFEFCEGPVDADDELHATMSMLLLEHARVRDEARR
jgi:CheY-like chemotaxis protein/Tfp pilus assembly protein PilZ